MDPRSLLKYFLFTSLGLGLGALVVLPFIMNDLVKIRFKQEMTKRCADAECTQAVEDHFADCFAGHSLRNLAQYEGGDEIVRCLNEASGKMLRFK